MPVAAFDQERNSPGLKNLCGSPVLFHVAPAFRRAFARINRVVPKADATKALHA